MPAMYFVPAGPGDAKAEGEAEARLNFFTMSDQHIGVGREKGARNRVRKFRKAKHWTQTKLAILANVSLPCVCGMERGKHRPQRAKALAIAQALNRPFIEVFPGYVTARQEKRGMRVAEMVPERQNDGAGYLALMSAVAEQAVKDLFRANAERRIRRLARHYVFSTNKRDREYILGFQTITETMKIDPERARAALRDQLRNGRRPSTEAEETL